ncbi:PPA1309 family protein [Nocardioides terrisoli]|uniref:PPA1309 family protein n=1 Tax=Nocardioides terrisoli TaxID=3388267 RepID=UPI00287B9FBC|nr:PPA1309 family protein [Nocardioides marmorisolisilvae]
MSAATDRAADPELTRVVRELEKHASEAGWDRPAQLFALVPTAELLEREPGLAALLEDAGELTSVQQEELGADELEELLERIVWPSGVVGCAAVVERLLLPPEAEAQIPTGSKDAAEFVAGHPARQEVRIVAGATRAGGSWCALRLRSHDEPQSVLVGDDLVPGLLELLHATLEPEPGPPEGEQPR